MSIIQPCPGCAATNQVQLERIAELEILNSNQRAMLEGKHEYVGQDFKFRMGVQAERIALLEAALLEAFQVLSSARYAIKGREHTGFIDAAQERVRAALGKKP